MRTLICLSLLWILPIVIFSQPDVEWPNYGNDKGGQRCAPISQVTPENVQQLEVAWTFRTQEDAQYEKAAWLRNKSAFEATPIMINQMLYFSSPSNRVFAVEAKSGKQLWEFNPRVDLKNTSFSELTNRGVSYWKGERDGDGPLS